MTEQPPEADDLTQRYAAWRTSDLGSITEQIEMAAVFEMLGPLEGQRLLDVGCGDGIYSVEAARRGARVTGLDLSEDMLNEARKRSLREGATIDWRVGDALRLPFADASFDVVVAITLLCLVPTPGAAVSEMARVLAPGGRLVIGELHRWSAVAAKRRIRGWGGNEFWREAHFWTAKELEDLMARAGLKPGRKRGAAYFPPSDIAARALSRFDPIFSRLGTPGAAFSGRRRPEAVGLRREIANSIQKPASLIQWFCRRNAHDFVKRPHRSCALFHRYVRAGRKSCRAEGAPCLY